MTPTDTIERVGRALTELATLRCYDERCTCSGYDKWDCLLGCTPEDLARAAIEAMPRREIAYAITCQIMRERSDLLIVTCPCRNGRRSLRKH